MRLLPSARETKFLALVFAVLSVTLLFPLNDDNGHWQSMAFDLIHFGRWPYVGTWDQNFPGMIVFHVVSIVLFGPSDFGFRLFDLLLQTTAAWMLFRFWRQWLPERTAWLAVLLYAFYYVRGDPFVGGERDIYASLLIIAASFRLLRQADYPISAREVVASALCAGFAVLIRPSYELYVLLLVVLTPLRAKPKLASIFLLGSVIPLALSFGVYALWPDALREYWTSTILFNLDTYGHIVRPFTGFWRSLSSPKLLVVPFAIGLVALSFWRKRDSHKAARAPIGLYIASLVVTLAVVLLQRKYYLYHFAMFSILLTPVAAIGLDRLLRYLPSRSQFAVFVACYFLCSLPYEELVSHIRSRGQDESPWQTISASFHSMVWPDMAEDSVVRYLNAPERSAGRVEVCSYDPRMRLHLGREPAGMYASLHALGFRRDPSDPNSFADYQQRWRRAYVDSLTRLKPRFIVICRGSTAEYLHDPYNSLLHDLPGFDSLLLASYQPDTIMGKDEIYRRRE